MVAGYHHFRKASYGLMYIIYINRLFRKVPSNRWDRWYINHPSGRKNTTYIPLIYVYIYIYCPLSIYLRSPFWPNFAPCLEIHSMKSSQRPVTLFGTSGSMCFFMSYCIYDVGMLSDVLHVCLFFVHWAPIYLWSFLILFRWAMKQALVV